MTGAALARQDRPGPQGARWRIWLVTDVYPPGCGGSGWSTHALARVLTDHGHTVEVVVIDPASDVDRPRQYEGVPVTEVGVRRPRRSPRRRLGARDYASAYVEGYLADRLTRQPGVDVVHGQHLHSGPPAIAAGRAHGAATVVTIRDYWPVCLHGTAWWGGSRCDRCTSSALTGCMAEYWRWPRPAARIMTGWAARRLRTRADAVRTADKVITVSAAVRRRIEPSLPGTDLSVVPNIVDPVGLAPTMAALDGVTGSDPYLLTAGKLQPTKGFDALLEALAAAGTALPLFVAGDGPLRPHLMARAAALGVRATFLGWVDHDRLLALQRGAHAVIVASAWEEPLSRLVLETMALGTPVIAWASGGTPEMIDDRVSGWLVHRPADLRAALSDLDAPGRRGAVGDAGRQRITERCSPGVVYPQVASLYSDAIAAARARHNA